MWDFGIPVVILLLIIWLIYKNNDELDSLELKIVEMRVHIDIIEEKLQDFIMRETTKDERD